MDGQPQEFLAPVADIGAFGDEGGAIDKDGDDHTGGVGDGKLYGGEDPDEDEDEG